MNSKATPTTILITSAESGPDSSWSLDQLRSRIVDEYNCIQSFARKTANHIYRLGQALALAKEQVKRGHWGEFLEKVGISVATDNRARCLFESCESADDVDGLTIIEAYEKAGVKLGKTTAAPMDVLTQGSSTHSKKTKVTSVIESDDDEEFSVEDPPAGESVAQQLEEIATWLSGIVKGELLKIESDRREEVRISIQLVTVAYDNLIETFFN